MKDRIKLIRKDAGLTQTQFGKVLANKSLSTVQKWEMGLNQPDSATIELICQKFDVSNLWLRTGAGEMRATASRAEEMTRLVKRLMADRPDSFRSALISTLLRLDPDGPEWAAIERIYNDIAAEQKKDQEP